MGCRLLMLLALLLAAPVFAEEAPAVRTYPPKVHNSACSLAESMANKMRMLGVNTGQSAEQDCRKLAPTMGDADLAEFIRCCVARLTAGPATAPAKP